MKNEDHNIWGSELPLFTETSINMYGKRSCLFAVPSMVANLPTMAKQLHACLADCIQSEGIRATRDAERNVIITGYILGFYWGYVRVM